MAYNGYSNWETWNVSLWLNNDEGLYNETRRFVRRNPHATGSDLEEFVKELLPNGTPDFDSVNEYNAVDWDEVLRTWAE